MSVSLSAAAPTVDQLHGLLEEIRRLDCESARAKALVAGAEAVLALCRCILAEALTPQELTEDELARRLALVIGRVPTISAQALATDQTFLLRNRAGVGVN